ncbi:MAG: 30S ribosomal protein S4, partial [Limisphaerales bacterium]
FHVVPGQEISVREKSRKMESIQRSLDLSGNRGVPPWLTLDRENLKAQVVSGPKREDVNFPIQEQMIVELYSK